MTTETESRLYRDLVEWYPLLTPVGDYVEEAAFPFDHSLNCAGGHDVFLGLRPDLGQGPGT